MEIEGSGGGKYDDQAERLINELRAEMVMLFVLNGKDGHGMSVCLNASEPDAKKLSDGIPNLLRHMADMIEHKGEFKQDLSPSDRSWSDLAKEDEEEK